MAKQEIDEGGGRAVRDAIRIIANAVQHAVPGQDRSRENPSESQERLPQSKKLAGDLRKT